MHAVSKMSPMVLPPMFNGGSDDHVTCRMCLIRFSYPARLPLSLHCLHTYCSQCVFSWTCNKTKSKLSCPMCGKMTKIDKGKKVQECLPINHAVLELAAMSSGQRDYQNGFNGQEQSQPFYHATQFNNLSPSSCDHGASNLHLPSRLQSDSPAKLIHAGHEHISGLNVNGSAQQTTESSCSLALENSKIYPDLPANQPSRSEVCNPCSGAAQWSSKSADNCGYNGYDAEKQTSACCNTNSACPPAPTKVQPGLQINIGSVKFQKRQEDKENENSSNGRHDSPCGMIENLQPAGAVTELCVNRSPRNAKRLPEVPKISCIPKINSDLCVRCNVNPASVTVTSERSVQRLCSDCHAATKEDKKCEDRDSRQRPVINEPPNNQARTVVKVQSKLNGESARCSPVWDPKTRQSVGESERKVDTSMMSSVLRLGDPVRTAAASPIVCSNQVGVICGPFKSEQTSKIGGGETDVRCSEANGVMVCSGRVETSNGGQSVGREERRARVMENSNAVSTAIDFGTIDQVKVLKKTSRDARTEVRTEVAAVNPRRSQPVVSNTRPTGRQEAGFRPREYVVGPAGMGVDSRGNGRAERGNRVSDVLLSVEELNRPAAFNPQYNDDFDTRSVSDLGLPTVEPVNLMQRATTKEHEAMGYSNNQSSPQYPTLSSPPRYEDIMAEAKLHGVPPGGGTFIPRFGRYGESSSHPGALRNPSRVSVSQDDRVAVADTHNKTIQVFGGQSGECMSLMRVDGVTGCCIARDGSIVVATNKGIEVYKANGVLNKKVDDMGSVINVAAYRNGFVAAQSKALVAFRDMNGGTSKTLTDMWKSGQYHHNKSFQNITDVAVNSQQDFVVLDSGTIYILTDEGSVRFVLKPHHQPCGPLNRATSVDVDERNNIVVCEGRRVLLFNAGGQYVRDIFEPITRGMLLGAGPELAAVTPQALGLGRNGRVYIAIKGDRTAEVIVLSYL